MNKKAVVGIVEHNGLVLIGKKQKKEGHAMSEEWHIPGGKVEKNETSKEALMREIKEEAGINVKISRIVEKIERPNITVLWYLCTADNAEVKPGDDIVDAKFIERKDLFDKCGPNAVSMWPEKVVEHFKKF